MKEDHLSIYKTKMFRMLKDTLTDFFDIQCLEWTVSFIREDWKKLF